jgi:hypothetical protein
MSSQILWQGVASSYFFCSVDMHTMNILLHKSLAIWAVCIGRSSCSASAKGMTFQLRLHNNWFFVLGGTDCIFCCISLSTMIGAERCMSCPLLANETWWTRYTSYMPYYFLKFLLKQSWHPFMQLWLHATCLLFFGFVIIFSVFCTSSFVLEAKQYSLEFAYMVD